MLGRDDGDGVAVVVVRQWSLGVEGFDNDVKKLNLELDLGVVIGVLQLLFELSRLSSTLVESACSRGIDVQKALLHPNTILVFVSSCYSN